MDPAFIKEMKELLLSEKTKLESELSRFAHRSNKKSDDFDSDFPNFGDDEDENATEVATYSNNLSLESELEKALRDVTNSLKRVKDKSYGTCKYCQSEIAEARLRARSTSTSCIACKKTLTQEV